MFSEGPGTRYFEFVMISDHVRDLIFMIFLRNCLDLIEMVEPRFCETLQCFHHILGDMTLPGGTKKQKSKPSEISVNFDYDKNKPNMDFPIFHVQF